MGMMWLRWPPRTPAPTGRPSPSVLLRCPRPPPAPRCPWPAILTAAALPAATPLRGRLRPAAPAPWQVVAGGLGKGAHLGPIVDARGAQSIKSARMGVAGEEAAVRRRRRPAKNVGDAVRGSSSQLGAQPGGTQLVEGALHRVLADGGLGLREGAQRGAVEQEGAGQVGVHVSSTRAALRGRNPERAVGSPALPCRGLLAHSVASGRLGDAGTPGGLSGGGHGLGERPWLTPRPARPRPRALNLGLARGNSDKGELH